MHSRTVIYHPTKTTTYFDTLRNCKCEVLVTPNARVGTSCSVWLLGVDIDIVRRESVVHSY